MSISKLEIRFNLNDTKYDFRITWYIIESTTKSYFFGFSSRRTRKLVENCPIFFFFCSSHVIVSIAVTNVLILNLTTQKTNNAATCSINDVEPPS
jgi:hypothetical protein